MIVEFDTGKEEINLAKHKVSLAFGVCVFDDPDYIVLPTIREGDEEERFKAIGMIDGKLWTAVHCYRGESVRFISVRRSNGSEQRNYDRNSG